MLASWKKSYDQARQHIKKQRHYFANKGLSSQSYGFSTSHVWMWELDCKESWVSKNWCFWTVCGVGEDSWEFLGARRSNQSTLKVSSPEYSLEGLMLKLNLLYFGHLMRRMDSLEKTLMLGEIEGRRRRGWQRMRWLDGHWLDGQEFDQAPGVGNGQGSLVYCSPWGHKESDLTKRLSNWTELNWTEGGLAPWELIPNEPVQDGVQKYLPSANGYPNQIGLFCKGKAQTEEEKNVPGVHTRTTYPLELSL